MRLPIDVIDYRAAIVGIGGQDFEVKCPSTVVEEVVEFGRCRVVQQASLGLVLAGDSRIWSFACDPDRDGPFVNFLQGNPESGEEFLDQSVELVVPFAFRQHHHRSVNFALHSKGKVIAQLKSLRRFPAQVVLYSGQALAHWW